MFFFLDNIYSRTQDRSRHIAVFVSKMYVTLLGMYRFGREVKRKDCSPLSRLMLGDAGQVAPGELGAYSTSPH